jgi:hypothetical protein
MIPRLSLDSTATVSTPIRVTCENCDTPVSGPFCANCGQEHHPTKVHFKDFVIEYVRSFVNVDSKSFKSLRLLLFKPGMLDAEYIGGKRASFIKPAELYLFMSVIFFFVVAHVDPLTLENSADLINKENLDAIYASKKISERELSNSFESKVQDKLPTFLIAVVPLLALFLGRMYNREKKFFFVHHLTFSYHFFTFLFLILIPGLFHEDMAAIGLFALFGYLLIALKRLYQQNYLITTVKAATVWLTIILLLYAYMYIAVNYSIIEIKNDLGI